MIRLSHVAPENEYAVAMAGVAMAHIKELAYIYDVRRLWRELKEYRESHINTMGGYEDPKNIYFCRIRSSTNPDLWLIGRLRPNKRCFVVMPWIEFYVKDKDSKCTDSYLTQGPPLWGSAN